MRNTVSVFACLGIALSLSLVAAEGHQKSGYTTRDGKVYAMKDGKETSVTAEVSFGNGSRLLPDGFIVFRDGRRERFRDSQWMSFEGEYILADVVADADDFDGYYFDAGRVYVYRDHHPVLVTTDITFGNGSRISADGSFYTREGTRSRMTEGQRVSKVGVTMEGKFNATARTNTTNNTNTNTNNNTNTSNTNNTSTTNTTNKTPLTPVDADHKVNEPVKTRLPDHKEKDVSPSPAQDRLTSPNDQNRTQQPDRNEKSEPARDNSTPSSTTPKTSVK